MMPDTIKLDVNRLRDAIRRLPASSTNDYMELLLQAGSNGHPVPHTPALMVAMCKPTMSGVERALAALEKHGAVKLIPGHVVIVGYAEMIRR